MNTLFQGDTLNDLRNFLKEKIKKVTLDDLYELSTFFSEEQKYLPENYKREYVESVQNIGIKRVNLLKNDDNEYEDILSSDDKSKINEILKKNNNTISYILNIIVIYTTYILREPIHHIDSEFPGRAKIEFDGKYYYCPIKKHQINNSQALCKYCIAKPLRE